MQVGLCVCGGLTMDVGAATVPESGRENENCEHMSDG